MRKLWNGIKAVMIGAVLVAAAVAIIPPPPPTLAQETAAVVVTEPETILGPTWQGLWNDALYPLILLAVTFVGYFAKRYLGERTGQVIQDSFQAAALRAAGKAVVGVGGAPLATPNVAAGVAYLKDFVPDKIKHFGLDDADLEAIVTANIGKLVAPTVVEPAPKIAAKPKRKAKSKPKPPPSRDG